MSGGRGRAALLSVNECSLGQGMCCAIHGHACRALAESLGLGSQSRRLTLLPSPGRAPSSAPALRPTHATPCCSYLSVNFSSNYYILSQRHKEVPRLTPAHLEVGGAPLLFFRLVDSPGPMGA